jgi:hypothetical protein
VKVEVEVQKAAIIKITPNNPASKKEKPSALGRWFFY